MSEQDFLRMKQLGYTSNKNFQETDEFNQLFIQYNKEKMNSNFFN